MTDAAYSTPRVTASGGPNPGMVALITLLLTLAGLIVGAAMSSGATLQSPFTSAEAFLARAQTDWRAMRVSAWLQVGSSVPLGIAAATLYARLQRLGVRVPGPVIALFGGIVAAVMLMLSGLVGWVLSRPEVLTTASVTQTLGFLWFMTGSVGFVLGIGLLVAGVAVPALILGLIPRWLAPGRPGHRGLRGTQFLRHGRPAAAIPVPDRTVPGPALARGGRVPAPPPA